MIASGAGRLGRGLLVRRREVVDFVHELLGSSGISSSSSSLLPSAKKAIQPSGHSHHWDLHCLTEDQRRFQSLASVRFFPVAHSLHACWTISWRFCALIIEDPPVCAFSSLSKEMHFPCITLGALQGIN